MNEWMNECFILLSDVGYFYEWEHCEKIIEINTLVLYDMIALIIYYFDGSTLV